MIAHPVLHGPRRRHILERDFESRNYGSRVAALIGNAQLAVRQGQGPSKILELCLAFGQLLSSETQRARCFPIMRTRFQSDCACSSAPMPAVQVQRQRGVGRSEPLELAGDSEQQSLPSILDPVTVLDRGRNDLHQVRERHALLEQFPAFVQPLKELDLRASLKGPAVQGRLDFFKFEDFQIRGDEIRPSLSMIAEEHEPEPLARRGDEQCVHDLRLTRPPVAEVPRSRILHFQHRDQARFAPG